LPRGNANRTNDGCVGGREARGVALEKIGLQGVFDLKGFTKAIRDYQTGIAAAEADTDKSVAPIQKGLSLFAKAATGAAVAAGTTAVAIVAGLGKLAIAAAPLEQIGAAFRGLGGDIEALREGALGMVADADLMKSYNTAAQLVSTTFAEELPEAMGYLAKVSASTGESMDYMVNSLVKGIGRLSPAILDNLQVQASLADGIQRATEMYGLQADQLSKSQQQAGMMSVVMEKLAANTANMPELLGSATQQLAALKVEGKNLADNMGKELLPALVKLLPTLLDLAEKAGPPLIDFATKAAVVFGELAGEIGLLVDFLSRGKDAILDYNRELSEGASTYEEYVAAAVAAERATGRIPAHVSDAAAANALLARGVIESSSAWTANNEAMEQADLRMSNTAVAAERLKDAIAGDGDEPIANIASMLFDPAQIEEAAQAAEAAAAEGFSGMLALQTKFSDEALKKQANFDASQAIAQAKHNARMAQLEAAGDKEGMARLQASFDESQTLSEWDLAVQKQLAERGELEQTVIEKRKHLEMLKAQFEAVKLSLKTDTLASLAKGEIQRATAKEMLRVLGISTVEGLKTEQDFGRTSAGVWSGWASNVETAADVGVSSMKAVLAAWDQDILAAEAALAEAQLNLANFVFEVPPLELPPIPSGFGEGVGEAVGDELDKAGIDQVFDAALNRVASGLQAMRNLITDITEAESIESGPFEQKLDNFLWAVGVVVEKTLVKVHALGIQFADLLDETGETSGQINATLAVLGQMANISQFGDDFRFLSGDWLEDRVDNFVWALKVVAIKLTDEMKKLRLTYGIDVLKEVQETSKVIAGALSPLGLIPDLMKIGEYEDLPEELLDQVLTDLGYLFDGMIDVANAAKDKIDQGTKDVVSIMGDVFGSLKSAIDTLLTLGGIEDYKSLFDDMGQSDIWSAIKADIGTLLSDIAGWNLLVDVDAIKAVRAKLDEARAVVASMLGITSDITSMREQGGADVGTFRAILTQFSDIINALGFGGPGIFSGGGGGDDTASGAPMNAPAMPSLAGAGAGGGNLGTITLRGEFTGPNGEFVSFTEEVALAAATDINLGQIGVPSYAY